MEIIRLLGKVIYKALMLFAYCASKIVSDVAGAIAESINKNLNK